MDMILIWLCLSLSKLHRQKNYREFYKSSFAFIYLDVSHNFCFNQVQVVRGNQVVHAQLSSKRDK